ncbi:MAG: RluA family pseudouridine synthase [Alphaproteobacteria bacterium]|nr:RluA family pseudouridine synthase [Alphaproteobacteria bacterium]
MLVTKTNSGFRIDKFLSRELSDMSRSRLKALIEEGCVIYNGEVTTAPSTKIKDGHEIKITIPEATPANPIAQDIPLDILYEDEHLIVVNKPVGMVVHPAPGSYDGTLVNALLHHCKDDLSGIGGVKRPGIVHRIDKDTSGILVSAKHDVAHNGLAEQFADHSIDRLYDAIIWGLPSPARGEINAPIGRDPKNRLKMAIAERGGKEAITHYKLLKTFAGCVSLVECSLETGRTHQIRVHFSSIGHHLVGDKIYEGNKKTFTSRIESRESREVLRKFHRQALHAKHLGFIHPITKEKLSFTAPMPDDMAELIKNIS